MDEHVKNDLAEAMELVNILATLPADFVHDYDTMLEYKLDELIERMEKHLDGTIKDPYIHDDWDSFHTQSFKY